MPLPNPVINQQAMTTLDKYLEAVSTALATVARKEAGIRDAFDDMARANIEFIHAPHVYNPTTKKALEAYAKHLVATQDYRQAKLSKIETNLVPLFMQLAADCKQMKSMRMRSLSSSEPRLSSSSAGNVPLEGSLNKQSGSMDALAQQHKNESELINFERDKLKRLKKALTDAVLLELSFHSRALEQLSPIVTAMHEINIEGDLQEYCKAVLNIASGGPAAIRNDSATTSPQTHSQPSPGVNPAVRKATTNVPPVPVVSKQQPVIKSGGNTTGGGNTQVTNSFEDEGEEEEEYEGEEYETTDASTAPGGPSNWVPPRGPALRQQGGSGGRPLTGTQGPPVPERSAGQPQQPSQPKPSFNASLFLGSSTSSSGK